VKSDSSTMGKVIDPFRLACCCCGGGHSGLHVWYFVGPKFCCPIRSRCGDLCGVTGVVSV
jgi:hypothetical protein